MLSIVHLCSFCLRMHRPFTLMVPSGSLWLDNDCTYIPAEVLLSSSTLHSVGPGTDTVCMLFMEEFGSHACNKALLHAQYSIQ